MIRRATIAILLVLGMVQAASAAPFAALVIDANTGQTLHERDADHLRHPASLTKLMTLYLIFEAIDAKKVTFSTRWAVSERAASQPPTKLGLDNFDHVTVRDVVLGLITRSANDAAVVAAEALASSVERFAQVMTRKARELGMSRTVFENASGLPDPQQVTTARDMARLARALMMQFPHHYPLFATTEFVFNGVVSANHNRLMGYYDGMDGLKTGYIRASGFNLVASAVRNGRRLIGVVMGGQSPGLRDAEMARLLDASFNGAAPLPAPQMRVAAAPQPAPTPMVAIKPPAIVLRPPAAATTVAPPAEQWAIQVGTFPRAEIAKYAAEQAMRIARKPLEGGDITVAPADLGKSKTYRARVTGLTQTQAKDACKILGARKDFDCAVIQPPKSPPRVATL